MSTTNSNSKINAVKLTVEKFKELFSQSINDSSRSNPFILGIGTGTTSLLIFEKIFEYIEEGLENDDIFVLAIPTSFQSVSFVPKDSKRIFLTSVSYVSRIDCLLDGADNVFERGKIIIKGGGGAHTIEKLLQRMSRFKFYIIEESKLSPSTTLDLLIPIEVLPIAANYVKSKIQEIWPLSKVSIREAKNKEAGKIGPIITDNGNIILDLEPNNKTIDMRIMAKELDSITGVIEHGIFIDSADILVVGTKENGYYETERAYV